MRKPVGLQTLCECTEHSIYNVVQHRPADSGDANHIISRAVRLQGLYVWTTQIGAVCMEQRMCDVMCCGPTDRGSMDYSVCDVL